MTRRASVSLTGVTSLNNVSITEEGSAIFTDSNNNIIKASNFEKWRVG